MKPLRRLVLGLAVAVALAMGSASSVLAVADTPLILACRTVAGLNNGNPTIFAISAAAGNVLFQMSDQTGWYPFITCGGA